MDGQTAEQYGLQLLENLQGLLDRAKSGTYRAPPVRRAYIPKGTGARPLYGNTWLDRRMKSFGFIR